MMNDFQAENKALMHYPFGMLMPGRNFSSDGYRFGFNGKENDDDVKGAGNSLDFGARIYDSRVSRWLSTDPFQKKYPSLCPYNFVSNMPLIAIDPDGKEIKILSKDPVFREFILNQLQKLTDDKLEIDKNGVVKIIHKSSNPSKPLGTSSIFQLVTSNHLHTIDYTDGSNETAIESIEGANDPNVGSGSAIVINPNEPVAVTAEDGSLDFLESQILVGHEILHSSHIDEGGIQFGRADPNEDNYDPDLGGAGEPMLNEEIRTRKEENILREEQKIKIKRKVSGPKNFGNNLAPVIITSPRIDTTK